MGAETGISSVERVSEWTFFQTGRFEFALAGVKALISVGLVEDRPYDLEKLAAILRAEPDVEIAFAVQDAEEAYALVKTAKPDILFADIEMPKLSGYELADLMHTHAMDTAVVFVTANSGYAVHAFELNVLDYIMKPYKKERLLKALERYRERRRTRQSRDVLMVRHHADIHFIRKEDILFIERTGRSTTIVTKDRHYETYQTLNELEEQLAGGDFIRAHRSYLIHIRYVKHFSLFGKTSYRVTFHHTNQKATITKAKLDELKRHFF